MQTVLGHGTTFKVKIPLTLAIIPALLVTTGGDCYAIPQVSLLELVRLDGHRGDSGIEWIQGVPVYRLRGRLLPLVFLNEVFGAAAAPGGEQEVFNIVVVQADDRQFGLVVDEINDTAEIVVKPLGRLLKHVNAFAGATIMGDGRVALILDVMGIANHVGVTVVGQRGSSSRTNVATEDAVHLVGNRRRLLLFSLGERRLGLPLEAVARLEQFRVGEVETASHRPVVQYRGDTMHLVHLAEQLGIPTHCQGDETMQVVVFNREGVSVGLVVDRIFDIVDEAFEISTRAAGYGIEGSAVIQGAVTDVVDVLDILASVLPDVFAPANVAVAA